MKSINSEVQMGPSEAFALITVCIITKMFYGYLPVAIGKYGPASWYISIISAVLSFAAFAFVIRNDTGVLEILRRGFGKTLGRIMGFAVYVCFLLYTAINLREIIRIIKIYNFPLTPTVVFAAGFLIVAVLINYNGLYSVSKLSEFYLKLILLAFILIFILGFGQYDFAQLAPYGGYGLKSIAGGSVTQLTLFSELFLLMVLVKQAGGGKSAVKTGIAAMAVSGVIVALSMAAYVCVFDYTVAEGKTSGLIEIVKNVYYGHLFQRMESLFFLMMVVSSAIALCVWFFSTVHIYSDVFNINDKRELLLPTALLVLCISSANIDIISDVIGRFSGLFLFGVAVLSKLLVIIRRRA